MSVILLSPAAVCFIIGFFTLGLYFSSVNRNKKVLYPSTLLKWKEKLLTDPASRYIYREISIWCQVAGSKRTPEGYILLSLLLSGIGILTGLFLQNIVVGITCFFLFLFLPILLLYARFVARVNKRIKSFHHFVDLFSRHYSHRKNIVLSFREMMEDCPKDLQDELILLNNTLTDGGNSVAAVMDFAERLNHEWAYDFATYIVSGLEGETEDIQSSLNRLTNEMYVYHDEREERKSELYAIWISLLIVIGICILFIPYNQTLLPDAYRLYFYTSDGQALLSIATMIWAFSVLLAFIWGRRHG